MITRLEALAEKLDSELAQRRRELSDINLSARSSAGNMAATLRRAGHVMTYAHWEGFTKFALSSYMTEICRCQIKNGELKEGLQAVFLSTLVNQAAIDSPVAFAASIMKAVQSQRKEVFRVQPDDFLKTGNLTSKKFRHLLSICSLEYLEYYSTRENFIDGILCGRRHRIAHGGSQPISEEDLQETVSEAFALCEKVNDQVIESLLYETYLHNTQDLDPLPTTAYKLIP